MRWVCGHGCEKERRIGVISSNLFVVTIYGKFRSKEKRSLDGKLTLRFNFEITIWCGKNAKYLSTLMRWWSMLLRFNLSISRLLPFALYVCYWTKITSTSRLAGLLSSSVIRTESHTVRDRALSCLFLFHSPLAL